jgi:hypothetical protein
MTAFSPSPSLRELVDKYVQLAGGFGFPVALSSFGFSQPDAERVFGVFDEDYHISRYFNFSQQTGTENAVQAYRINGFPQSHVALDAEIKTIL